MGPIELGSLYCNSQNHWGRPVDVVSTEAGSTAIRIRMEGQVSDQPPFAVLAADGKGFPERNFIEVDGEQWWPRNMWGRCKYPGKQKPF